LGPREKYAFLLVLSVTRTTSHLVGEFLRECAALVLVFVPLEMWRSQAPPAPDLLWHVAEASFILFVIGVLCEYASLFLGRVKGDLENAWRT
jgi:hypothetical protein